jgi:uncharacterized protein (DUF736 family)
LTDTDTGEAFIVLVVDAAKFEQRVFGSNIDQKQHEKYVLALSEPKEKNRKMV